MRTLHKIKRLSCILLLLSCQAIVSRAQYCSINFSAGGEAISLVDFAGINNVTSNTSTLVYEDFTAMTGTVVQGQTSAMTVQSNTYGAYSNWVRVYIDWNQNSDFSDPGESYDLGSIYNSTGLDAVVATGNITVPITALTGTTRMRVTAKYAAYTTTACNTTGYGQAEDYTISVLGAGACVGTPVAGTAAGPAAICPGVSFGLSLTGYSAAGGISFEWQADDGGGWQPIPGATDPTYTAAGGISTTTNYQAVVTCTNGGSQDLSNILTVNVNAPTQCYCTISFSSPDPITLVEFGGVSNPTAASGAPVYEDFTSLTANVVEGQYYVLNVKGTTGGAYTDSIRAFIDWDQNGSFNDPGEFYDLGAIYNSTGTDAVVATANIFIPNGVLTGTTRLRVTKAWNYYPSAGPCNTIGYGQAEDYSVNVVASTTCFGAPVAGTASGPASVCAATMFTLTLTGYTVAAGADIQWEYFDSGLGSWQAIAGATTAVWNEPGLMAARDYRAVITCTNGGLTDISNTVSVAITPFTSCYCTTQNFGGASLLNVSISGTTLNNTSTGGSAVPYYTFYPPTGNTTADLMEGVTYSITGGFSVSAIASVWIDFNMNGQFESSEWTQIATTGTSGTASFIVPPGTPAGQTGMRVRTRLAGGANGPGDACLTMSSGETEDYIVTILPAITCSGTPVAGVAAAPATMCAGLPFTIDLSGFTIANGISLQWEEDAGSGWQPVPGATNSTYVNTAGITTATSYRAVFTCSNAGSQDISTVATVALTPVNQCYCNISFTSGDVEPITLVDVAGISNTSSDVIAGSPQYEDFTGVTGSMATGQIYPISVKGNTNGSYTDYIRVFIDWDQNGSFADPGESFDIGTLYNSTGVDAVTATSNITVPLTALYGSTRMRVTKKWSSYATACNTTGYGQAEDYLLTIGFPLAIGLKDISATNQGSANKIDWLTATELKGDYFELERSMNGNAFSRIATITAKGAAGAYSYTDVSPYEGINYYRLKLTDAAGKSSYSKTVTAFVKGAGFTMEAYPNPAGQEVTLDVRGGGREHATIILSDVTGKVLLTTDMAGNKAVIDLSNVPEGVYLLRYLSNSHSQTIKLNKL